MTRHNEMQSHALAALTDRARHSVALLGSTKPWVGESGADIDVAVIGGGQSGVGAAFALRRAGIHNVAVFEQAPEGEAGVWCTTARMRTLRTPKDVPGLEFGIPELTFKFWYSSLHGADAYEALDRAPRLEWQTYIDWYRHVVDIRVLHRHRLLGLGPSQAGVALRIETPEGLKTLTARRVVLANGVDGAGEPFLPEAIRDAVPESVRAHTADRIDFRRLAGKRLGVVGSAASAFDAAIAALEAGASCVDLLCRSPTISVTPPPANDWQIEFPRRFFHELSDGLRWAAVTDARRRGNVPEDTVARARAFAGFRMHPGTAFDGTVSFDGSAIRIKRGAGDIELDYLVLGTGYRTDLTRRPELAALAPYIELWRDRDVQAQPGDRHWLAFPYLDKDFALRERQPGSAPWVGLVHLYNYAAVLSHGVHVGDIMSAPIAMPRLVEGIARSLHDEDRRCGRKRPGTIGKVDVYDLGAGA